MKKTIVLAIAIGLCTVFIGNSFAKGDIQPLTTPQDTSNVRQLPPISQPPQDSTDTQSSVPTTTSPQSPDTPPSSPDSNNQVDSANAD